MQKKTESPQRWALRSAGRRHVMKINTANNSHVMLDGQYSFVYIGSIVDKQGGTDSDVVARVGKASVHAPTS